MIQWLRIYLPIQGTQVRFLVQEDPICHEQLSLRTTTTEACTPRVHTLQQEKLLQ